MGNEQIIQEGPGVFIEGIRVKESRFVARFDGCVRGLNHEKKILLRRHVEAGIIKVRDAKGLRRWSDLAQFHKK